MKSSLNLKSRGFRSRRFLMKFDVSNLKFPYKVIDTKIKIFYLGSKNFQKIGIELKKYDL